MSTESSPLQDGKKDQNCVLRNIKIFTRTLGIITFAVLWISCVFIIQDHDDSYVGYYLIPVAVIVTFFEITWILDKLACCVREGCCCKVWAAILWVDTWIKFLLYTGLAIPLFLEDNRILLGIVSGLLLIIVGALYLIKTFRGQVTVTVYKTVTRKRQPGTLVLHEISTQTEEDLFEVVATPAPAASSSTNQNQAGEEASSENSAAASTSAASSQEVPEDGGASSTPKKAVKK
ncbi:hypothetical protein PoB_001209100 [Plakobranchus ocellatus]|uniref:MARVEL domain-containing protein n=1 Tax=Plakobranchus ocellatus TaxID=259542 RepID=A0AAV3YT50_9GAST|nr:hypothetical protein PoB_001209100 [Plakobranchus ocellatus]